MCVVYGKTSGSQCYEKCMTGHVVYIVLRCICIMDLMWSRSHNKQCPITHYCVYQVGINISHSFIGNTHSESNYYNPNSFIQNNRIPYFGKGIMMINYENTCKLKNI